jgi:hypothetical protein
LDSEDPKELKDTAKKQLDIVINLLIRLTDKKIALEKFLIGQKFNEAGKKNLLYNYDYIKEAYDRLCGMEPEGSKTDEQKDGKSIDALKEMPKFDNMKLAEQIAITNQRIKESNILENDNMQHRFVSSLVGNRNLHLIYRASVHGDEAEDYHNNCDGKPNTLTLIKSE